jgi:hypothetical protein
LLGCDMAELSQPEPLEHPDPKRDNIRVTSMYWSPAHAQVQANTTILADEVRAQ